MELVSISALINLAVGVRNTLDALVGAGLAVSAPQVLKEVGASLAGCSAPTVNTG